MYASQPYNKSTKMSTKISVFNSFLFYHDTFNTLYSSGKKAKVEV